ncbi:MAG: mechanosensitive ion channel [Bacteroidales bacterium]|nr:mechanosensitive ion channel [Bacteroidales bacterium]
MLHNLLQIPAAGDTVNLADSAKVAISSLVSTVKEDPNAFLSNLGKEALAFGLKVLAALAIYIVGAFLIKKIKQLLNKSFARKKTEPTIATFVSSLVGITLTVLLVIITISALGVNTTSLAALLAAGGVAIGMALSGTVQNFAGGIMLLIFKPFKVGDFIEAQGFIGTVKEVNIVSTKMTTLDNRVIVIPNGALSNGNIDNYSVNPLRRVDWTVNVAYGNDVQKCIDELSDIVKADARVLNASTQGAADPFVALSKLGESTITFVVRAWVNAPDYWDVFFDFNKKVYAELPGRGVNFSFPQMNVHLHQD